MPDLKVVVEGPEKDSCMTCEFCKVGEIDINLVKTAICRRFPPLGFPIPTQGGIATVTTFPAVTKDMICFEYQRMREIF